MESAKTPNGGNGAGRGLAVSGIERGDSGHPADTIEISDRSKANSLDE